jgi:ketosteroid isomerase-like protein
VENLQPANNDEAEIFLIVQNLQQYISTSQWDKWLAMYSDDAILTSGKKNVTKEEMRKMIDGFSYKITKMEVTKKQINAEDAFVSVSMIGNGKHQLETYHFKKINNSWRIVKETNP